MALSRVVSEIFSVEIDGDIHRKYQNFPTPFVFCAPAEGVSLGMVWYGILEFNVPLDTV